MAFADFENLLKESMGLDAASIGASAVERAVLERAVGVRPGRSPRVLAARARFPC